MFLIMPTKVLRNKKLSWEARILLAYVGSLHRNGLAMFASTSYLSERLGISDPIEATLELERLHYIYHDGSCYRLTPEVEKIFTDL